MLLSNFRLIANVKVKQARARVSREELNKMGAQFAARMMPGGGRAGSAMQVCRRLRYVGLQGSDMGFLRKSNEP